MAITQAMCTSFKGEILQGAHNFNALSFVLTAVANASTGTTTYTGTITSGGSNAYAGMWFTIAGFATAANNGTFLCTASTTTTLVLTNNVGASETHAGTAASGFVYKLALYTSSASLDATTTAYSATNEIGNTGSYSAGGGTLTNSTPVTSGTTGLTTFSTLTFTTATITCRAALIYNSSNAVNRAAAVLDFGADKSCTSGTFTITFPTADASNAILRIA